MWDGWRPLPQADQETVLHDPTHLWTTEGHQVWPVLFGQALHEPCVKRKCPRTGTNKCQSHTMAGIQILTSWSWSARCNMPYVEDHRIGISIISCFARSMTCLAFPIASLAFSMAFSACTALKSSFRLAEERSCMCSELK